MGEGKGAKQGESSWVRRPAKRGERTRVPRAQSREEGGRGRGGREQHEHSAKLNSLEKIYLLWADSPTAAGEQAQQFGWGCPPAASRESNICLRLALSHQLI